MEIYWPSIVVSAGFALVGLLFWKAYRMAKRHLRDRPDSLLCGFRSPDGPNAGYPFAAMSRLVDGSLEFYSWVGSKTFAKIDKIVFVRTVALKLSLRIKGFDRTSEVIIVHVSGRTTHAVASALRRWYPDKIREGT